MDIITFGDFVITNINNLTVFSFRFPSQTTIDFVKENKIAQIQQGKVFVKNSTDNLI